MVTGRWLPRSTGSESHLHLLPFSYQNPSHERRTAESPERL